MSKKQHFLTRPARKVWLIAGIPAATMLLAGNSAYALTQGVDFNLAHKPASGGMAGAAYTRPQEVSAAVFGNPATLTQFKGFNVGIGASLVQPMLENEQTAPGFSNISGSSADNYLIPDFALSNELAPGWVIGGGMEVDSGIGADYRSDPITVAGGAITLPLLVELISFNANLGLAKQVTPEFSIGGALTIGFGLVQLGTAGNTTGINTVLAGGAVPLADFGGTTASVHDIAFGASLGATFQPMPALTLSAAIKSPVEYSFKNIIHRDLTVLGVGTASGWQNLDVEMPMEIIVGGAFDVTPELLVELDVNWKNFSNAKVLEDVFDDQFAVMLGAQYTMGSWKLRAGYTWYDKLLLDEPNGTLGTLDGLGTLPLNVALPGIVDANDIVQLVQTTLLPVIWQHVFSVGAGVELGTHTRLDVHAIYALEEKEERNGLGALGNFEATLSGWAVGGGLNMRF